MQLHMGGIYKSFKDTEVLKGITVRMDNGVYGLPGPNGSGKTTMIRILADILQPSKGQVFINGQDKNTCGDEYRAKIGYLPQEMSFYPDFTGWDYLQYIAALKGIPVGEAKIRIVELTDSVGLTNDLRRRCIHYSGGMKRRLGIAQALLCDCNGTVNMKIIFALFYLYQKFIFFLPPVYYSILSLAC